MGSSPNESIPPAVPERMGSGSSSSASRLAAATPLLTGSASSSRRSNPFPPAPAPAPPQAPVSTAASTKVKSSVPPTPLALRESTAAEREAALLKRTFAASTFGGIGDYLRNKRAKLQLQNAELATNAAPTSSSLSTAGSAAQIFAHKIIYINGFTDPSPADLRALFLTHGGRVEPYLDRKAHGFVTHVVATNLTPAKMKEYRQLKVVWPAWIVDSVAAGRLLPWSNYRWTPGSVYTGANPTSIASSAAASAGVTTTAGQLHNTRNDHTLSPSPEEAEGGTASAAAVALAAPRPRAEHLAPVVPSRTLAEAFAGQRGRQQQARLTQQHQQQQGIQSNSEPQSSDNSTQQRPPATVAAAATEAEDEGELLIMDAPPSPAPPSASRPKKRKVSPSPPPSLTTSDGRPKSAPAPLGPSRSSKRLMALAEAGGRGFRKAVEVADSGGKSSSNDQEGKAGVAAARPATAKKSEIGTMAADPNRSTSEPIDLATCSKNAESTSDEPKGYGAANPAEESNASPLALPFPSADAAMTAIPDSTTTAAAQTLTTKATAARMAPPPAVFPQPGSEAATLSAKKGYWMAGENVQAKRLMAAGDGWRERHTAVNEGFLEGYYANSRLHHLSTWKAELKLIVAKAQADVSSGGSLLLAPGSSQPATASPDDILGDTSIRSKGRNGVTAADLSLASHRLLRSATNARTGATGGSSSSRETVILHCDFDAFFVAVSLKRRPDLVGQPVVVCHSTGASIPTSGGGGQARPSAGDDASTSEIASASYEARAFGIKAGMSLGQARKLCSDVQAVPYDFVAYKTTALTTYTILLSYADILQAVSIDEALLDVTGRVAELEAEAADSPQATDDWACILAERIRTDVRQATACEISIGIGSNVLLARLATRRAKPAGSFHLVGSEVRTFLDPLDVKDLWGIGRNTRDKIATAFKTTRIGELVVKRVGQLQDVLGPKNGQTLYDSLRGIDHKPVVAESERKSVSAEVNYGIRFRTQAEADEFLVGLAAEVSRRMRSIDRLGKALTLKVMVRADGAPVEAPKFMGHGVCNDVNRSKELSGPRGGPTDDPDVLGKAAVSLLKAMNLPPEELRGIGMMVTKLERRVPLAKPREAGQTALLFAAKPPAAQTTTNPVTTRPPSPALDVIEIGATAPAAESSGMRGMSHVPVRKPPPPPPTPRVPSISQVPQDILDALPSSVVRETWPDFRRPPVVEVASPASDNRTPPRPVGQGVTAADGSPLRKRSLLDVSHIAKQLRPNRQSPMKSGVGLFQTNAAAGPSRPSPKRAGSSKTSVTSTEEGLGLDAETVELAGLLGWDLAFLRDLPIEDLRLVVADGRQQRKRLPKSAQRTPDQGKAKRADRLAVDSPVSGGRSRSATQTPDRSPSKRGRSPSTTGPYPPPPILGSRKKLPPAEVAAGQPLDTLRDDLSAWIALEAASGPSERGVRMLADFVAGSLRSHGHGAKARGIGVLRWLERELEARWAAERAATVEGADSGKSDATPGQRWWAAFHLCKRRVDEEVFIPIWGGPLVL